MPPRIIAEGLEIGIDEEGFTFIIISDPLHQDQFESNISQAIQLLGQPNKVNALIFEDFDFEDEEGEEGIEVSWLQSFYNLLRLFASTNPLINKKLSFINVDFSELPTNHQLFHNIKPLHIEELSFSRCAMPVFIEPIDVFCNIKTLQLKRLYIDGNFFLSAETCNLKRLAHKNIIRAELYYLPLWQTLTDSFIKTLQGNHSLNELEIDGLLLLSAFSNPVSLQKLATILGGKSYDHETVRKNMLRNPILIPQIKQFTSLHHLTLPINGIFYNDENHRELEFLEFFPTDEEMFLAFGTNDFNNIFVRDNIITIIEGLKNNKTITELSFNIANHSETGHQIRFLRRDNDYPPPLLIPLQELFEKIIELIQYNKTIKSVNFIPPDNFEDFPVFENFLRNNDNFRTMCQEDSKILDIFYLNPDFFTHPPIEEELGDNSITDEESEEGDRATEYESEEEPESNPSSPSSESEPASSRQRTS